MRISRRPRLVLWIADHEPAPLEEAAFLNLGEGARLWLTEAAAAGTTKMRVKMGLASALAKLFDPAEVDWALGHAAVHGRFAEKDWASILDHHTGRPDGGRHRASEDRSLTQGTAAWSQLGTNQQADDHQSGVDEVTS